MIIYGLESSGSGKVPVIKNISYRKFYLPKKRQNIMRFESLVKIKKHSYFASLKKEKRPSFTRRMDSE